MAAGRGLFEDIVGFDASLLSPKEIKACRYRLYEHLRQETAPRVFLKAHDAYDPALFPSSSLNLLILIVRNPLDISVSLAEFSGMSLSESVDFLNSTDSSLCDSPERGYHQLPQLLGSWSRHCKSWLETHCPRIVIRFEDLIRDPKLMVRKLYRFVGYTHNEALLCEAVEANNFQSLCGLEKSGQFEERSIDGHQFFRAGRVGDWKRHLSSSQVESIIVHHGDVMQHFGYDTEV